MPSKSFFRFARVGSLAVSISLLTACVTPPAPLPTATLDAAIPKQFADYYSQTIDWKSCGGARTYCTTVEVPLDWSTNDGQSLKLSVAYRQADNAKPLGSVIFNPAGRVLLAHPGF